MVSVNRVDWFKQAIKKDRWKSPGWVTQVFCVTELQNMRDVVVDPNNPPEPYDIFAYMDDKTYCYWDEQEKQFIQLNALLTEPILSYKDRIDLDVGDLPNIREPVNCPLGNVIVNLYMCVYAFGDKVPFFTGRLDGTEIQKYIIQHAAEEGQGDTTALFPKEIKEWKKATSALAPFSMIASPSGSRASFTIHKEVLQLRDELLKKHKDELHDPTIVALIENECVKYDIELRKGDISDGFFMGNKKLQAIGRKKQKIMYGIEGGLTGETQVITQALSDGMNFKDIPLYADATTAASQSRGLLTAQGGELVKYILRMFQNTSIVEDDCGTHGSINIEVAEWLLSSLPTRFMFVGNKTVMIDEEMAKGLLGKTIRLRSPGYCITSGRNYCKACTNVKISQRPNGVATATSRGSSRIMNQAMKAMHGEVAEVYEYDINHHLC